MTSKEFFDTVDILDYLRTDREKILNQLIEIDNEISEVTDELENLIYNAEKEFRDDDNNSYYADIRIFAGFNDEKLACAKEKILQRIGE